MRFAHAQKQVANNAWSTLVTANSNAKYDPYPKYLPSKKGKRSNIFGGEARAEQGHFLLLPLRARQG
jgi:hypothetical protein